MVNSSEMLPIFEIDQVKILPALEQSSKDQSIEKMMDVKLCEDEKDWKQNISLLYDAQVVATISEGRSRK